MSTLNAKANAAYRELIAATERENPGDVWAGFEHERDAFETGWEAGHEAAQPVALGELSDAVLMVDGYDVVEGDVVPPSELWAVVAAARKVVDAAPQPVVDREALAAAAHGASVRHVWAGAVCTPTCRRRYLDEADAVLALLNGGADRPDVER